MAKNNRNNQNANSKLVEEAATRLAEILIAQVELGSSVQDNNENEEDIFPSDLKENNGATRPIASRKIPLTIEP